MDTQDGKQREPDDDEVEPIYGRTYLPRKFKITVAVPPSNDVDVYANDLSFIAIVEEGKLVGFNVAVGGFAPGSPDEDTVFPVTMEVDWVRVYSGQPPGD